MNNKHACVYYKDKLYTVCHYFSIHTIDEREYVLRHGYCPDIREKRFEILPEFMRGIFTGKYVILFTKRPYSVDGIFQRLYTITISSTTISQLTTKYEELFETYLLDTIYIHDSVFRFFKDVVYVKKPQLY